MNYLKSDKSKVLTSDKVKLFTTQEIIKFTPVSRGLGLNRKDKTYKIRASNPHVFC